MGDGGNWIKLEIGNLIGMEMDGERR